MVDNFTWLHASRLMAAAWLALLAIKFPNVSVDFDEYFYFFLED